MMADVEKILKVCGLGTYLHIGCGNGAIVFELLKRTADAYGMDSHEENVKINIERAPSRFCLGSLSNFPFDQGQIDTIIIGPEIFTFKPEHFSIVMESIRKLTNRHLVLYFPDGFLQNIPPERQESNRLYWEKMAITAGFRRHPREMLAIPYESLENERLATLTFFEKVPESSHDHFPYSWLLQNRDLHMDMLREAGRRSDGHVSRYVIAAQQVRPGDVVLDAACGLGYGTAVLAACSNGAQFIGVDIDEESIAYANANYAVNHPAIKYHASDVTTMSFLPDHSVDMVVSFETIEHVPNYDIFLAEVARVLKPDGRFIGSVPNMWCDETGNDPNPYHFHVFDWNKLHQAISKYFIVDGRWAQNAGGGFRLREQSRAMQSVPLFQQNIPDTEWWLISACANPLSAQNTPYQNPYSRHHEHVLPTHTQFETYYDNPWLYRTMIQLGERIADSNILTAFCAQVASTAREGSADQGAALCVLGYQLLESGSVNLESVKRLIECINKFDQAYDPLNPHAWRWAISLHFIGGRLLLAIGNRDDALAAFLNCAAMDPVKLTPLLATKTISARMYAGLLYAGAHRYPEARQQFSMAIKDADRVMHEDWRTIVGDLDNPLPFGMQEAAEVLELTSQCVQALHALDRQDNSPGYFWERINIKRFGLVEWNKSLQRENDDLRRTIDHLARQKNAAAVKVTGCAAHN